MTRSVPLPVLVLGSPTPSISQALAHYRLLHMEDLLDLESLDDEAKSVRAVVTGGVQGLPPAIMDLLPDLEIVAINGVGYDRIDMARVAARGIVVTNTPNVLSDDVADMAVGLLHAISRRIVANDRFVRTRRWAAGEQPALTSRVTGKRIGIFGLGSIGGAIAHRLKPIAGQIAYYSRRAVPDVPYRYTPSLVELARESQVLFVSAKGGAQTRHLVNADVIDALGPEGILINVSRGSVVDEAALVDALVGGRLGGAGLDVFEDEPFVPESLFALSNVVLQPHQASATHETRWAMAAMVRANLDAHFAGRPLPTPVE